ncbi:uncharacterized protein BcabD6B2_34660 [Babesia caballi]|uniref:Uncharacterized protein n=1 Tax=Babesia caballi TaxID=5871 RepID=A0AAV4LY08_BABCB|nr:hypothetical protein BcabD6B2_34660 [Babesia caballi]
MEDSRRSDDAQALGDALTIADRSPPSPSTHLHRIQNTELPAEAAGSSSEENAPLGGGDAQELPEGWVRHGTGLMFDVPITPRMRGADRGKSQPPHFRFTHDNDDRDTRQLRSTLLHLDREAVRKMKREQSVKVRAAQPPSGSQRPAAGRNTTVAETPTRCSRQVAAQNGHMQNRSLRIRAEKPAAAHATEDDAFNRKVALMKRQHERELLEAKKQVLDHVDALVRKYRQLAIDAVKVAREEQRKAEQERRNAYDACARYEADLKTNVRNAIAHLKLSAQVEQERLSAERDAFQRKCMDLVPSKAAHKPVLDHFIAQLTAQFKDNQKFSIGMVDDARDMFDIAPLHGHGRAAAHRAVREDQREHDPQGQQQGLSEDVNRAGQRVGEQEKLERVLAYSLRRREVRGFACEW